MNSKELSDLFFSELKQYNNTNFKQILEADFEQGDYKTCKCCSSVVTRYFIFSEKHPEISKSDIQLLYYTLKIDLIAQYFSQYPAAPVENLKPFQEELRKFEELSKVKSEVC